VESLSRANRLVLLCAKVAVDSGNDDRSFSLNIKKIMENDEGASLAKTE